MAEQLSLKQFIAGSNPAWSTTLKTSGQDIHSVCSTGLSPVLTTTRVGSLTAKTLLRKYAGSIPALPTNHGSDNDLVISLGSSPNRTTNALIAVFGVSPKQNSGNSRKRMRITCEEDLKSSKRWFDSIQSTTFGQRGNSVAPQIRSLVDRQFRPRNITEYVYN